MLLEDCSACYSCNPKAVWCSLQMNCDTLAPQVVDSQDTADDVPAQVVKDKHLPDRFTVLVEKRVDLVLCVCCIFTRAVGWQEIVVQTQYVLDRRYIALGQGMTHTATASLTYLTITKCLHARRHGGRHRVTQLSKLADQDLKVSE